jgi:hypothetical protein
VWSRSDIELDFIREFSHSGAHIGPGVSSEERRERIRSAILREHKEGAPFRETGQTYAEIYKLAYNKSIEQGRVVQHDAVARERFARAELEEDDQDEEDGPSEELLEHA